MYKLFLDETGDHNLNKIDQQYPIFVLAGCVFEEVYYEKTVMPKIEQLKIKYFGSSEIVLHSYDIRKQKHKFKALINKKTRKSFYKDLHRIISGLDFKVIASVILKNDLDRIKHKLKRISKDPYEISFEFILERFLDFLRRNNARGEMSFESRGDHSNVKLLNLYEGFKEKGASNIKAGEIKDRMLGISFPDKKANIVGHQLADITAYPIARHILNPEKENETFNALFNKILRGKAKKLEGYGLKIFPKKRYIPKIIKGPRLP